MSMAAEGLDVLLTLACYLAYAWCASCFFSRQLRGKVLEKNVFMGLFFGGRVVMAMFLENGRVPYFLYAQCGHVLLIGLVMAVFSGGGQGKKLTAAVVWEAMTELIWGFVQSLLCCIGLISLHFVTGSGPMTFIGIWGERVILLASYGMRIMLVNLLSKPLSLVFAGKRSSWYACMAVPLAGIIFVTDFVNWGASNGIMVQSWGKYGLYENQLFSHGAMCIFTGLAMAAAGCWVFGMDKIYREEQDREQYRCQAAYFQMMEEQYRQVERLRHDMKNHMIALENLVQNQQWERAGAYLKDMEKAGNLGTGDEATGSLVMDALLYHKRCQAADRGIRWQCDARLPENSPIKEMDLCIIVGNILDNAVEACERLQEKLRGKQMGTGYGEETCKEPFIRISIGKVKKCLFLEVQNSTDIIGKPETGKSQKAAPGSHGLGIANIRAAAADYNGAVHMEAENGVFTVSVLLPLYEEIPGDGSAG